MAARGSEESRRRADAPRRARAWLATRVIDIRETRLTESDLETVRSTLADTVGAIQVERAHAITPPPSVLSPFLPARDHSPDTCDQRGDTPRAREAGDTTDDAQGAHHVSGVRRLEMCYELDIRI